jgi:hypothetical protein
MSSLGTSTENRTRTKSYQAGRQGNAERFTQPLLKLLKLGLFGKYIRNI